MPCKTLHLLLILQLAIFPALFSQTSEQARANLYALDASGNAYLYDGNLTMYNVNNSNTIDGMDAVKMTNFGENFGLLRGTTTLVIERRKSISTSDTIFFKMWNMHQKTYKVELQLTGLNHPGMTGVLEDTYLNTKTNINLNGTTSSIFVINSDVASSLSTRFRIIFTTPLSAPLPVTFTGFKAYQKSSDVNVEWSVENEKSIAQYQILRSVNGQQFSTVGTIDEKGNNASMYQWTDNSSVNGNNFYRIKSVDISGQIQYSNILKVTTGISSESISVYPNPVVSGIVNLQLGNQPKGIYTVRLYNNFGQMINTTQVKHDGGSSTQTMQVNKNLGKGNYQLEIIKPDNSKTNIKIVVQ